MLHASSPSPFQPVTAATKLGGKGRERQRGQVGRAEMHENRSTKAFSPLKPDSHMSNPRSQYNVKMTHILVLVAQIKADWHFLVFLSMLSLKNERTLHLRPEKVANINRWRLQSR